MATQDVVVRYRADVEELTRQLNVIVDKQQDIVKQEKDANATLEKGVTAQQQAAKKRLELLKLEEAELKKLKELRKTAFDPKTIRDYDARIAQATANIKTLGGKVGGIFGDLNDQVKSIGAGIAAGFGAVLTTQAVIDFGKASVNAFLEAEENANRLKFAIVGIAGESENAFNRLIKQSAELQKATTFSDDSIQQAQARLASFGLTAQGIEKIIPVLADFATELRIDIPEAAEKIGAALEGNGKEFKKYNIEVSATASRTENLNRIIDGLSKFQGSAAEATKTLAGQLKQQANAADDLQEKIGEGLAPVFVKLKTVVFEAILGLIGFRKAQEDLAAESTSVIEKNIDATAIKIKESGGDVTAEFTKRIEQLKNTSKDALTEIDNIQKKIADRTVQLSQQRSDIRPEDDPTIKRLNAQIEATQKIIELNDLRISKFQQVIETEANGGKLVNDTLDETTKKLVDLTKLYDILSGLKINNIQDEEVKRIAEFNEQVKGITEEVKKLNAELAANGQDQDIAKAIELKNAIIKEMEIDLGNDLKAIRQKNFDEAFRQLDKWLDDEAKRIDAEKEKRKAQNEALFEFKAKFTLDTQGQEEALDVIRTQLFKVFQAESEAIDASVQDSEVAAALKQQAYDKYTTSAIEMLRKLGIFEGETYDDSVGKAEEAARKKQEANQALLDNSISIVNSLVGVFNNFYESQITDINRTRDAQLEALDVQQKAIDDQLEKRRISEEQAQNQTAKLAEKRVETEKRAADKERQIKKKQAELNKANALVQIAISTAQGVARAYADLPYYLAVPVSVLVAAAGVAQGALVASEPIPYEKGSKDTGSKGHMARVGEKGEEIVYMPSHSKVLPAKQTKTYGEALDAMYDNRFEKFVMKKYVTPALIKQKQTYEDNRQETLVKNISQSYMMQYTGLTASEMDAIRRKGQPISNADQIGAAVAEAMSKVIQTADPYRR